MTRTTGYSIAAYGDMMQETVRRDAYVAALRAVVSPGAVVLDIGAGTGFMSLVAAQLGAGHVYAVEPDDAILVAREIAADCGLAERITFIQDISTRVNLPTPADVIVSDLRGVLPLLQHHLPAIVDARERLLAPGGALVPRCDRLFAAVTTATQAYRGYDEPWRRNALGLDLTAGRRYLVNQWQKVHLTPEALLTEPAVWATLDYRSLTSPDVAGELRLSVRQPGIGHGVVVWFDAELTKDVGFSNAPGQPRLIYGSGFFPWPETLALHEGDQVELSLAADLVTDDYLWRWHSKVTRGDTTLAEFDQSTLKGSPLSLGRLKQTAAGARPRLAAAAQVDRYILDRLDGATSLGEIASELAARFPAEVPTWQAGLTRAGELALRYGEKSTAPSP